MESTIGDVTVESDGSLVGPAAGHVPDGVASSSEEQEREVVATDEVHTLCMTCGERGVAVCIERL